MNTLILRTAALCLATCTPVLATPPLPAERLSVTTLPPNNPHRVYVLDDAFENEIDARVHLFDGDTYQRLGQIDAGFNPGFNLSPDAKTSIVGTTYFSRGSRGARTDVVEFTDNSNLKVTHEIVLPPKRAMGLRSAGPPHPHARSRRPRLRLTAMAAAYVSMRTMTASPA